MKRFINILLLSAALMLIGGIFSAPHAMASLPYIPSCSDGTPIQGNFELTPARGPVGTPFKLTGSNSVPDQTLHVDWINVEGYPYTSADFPAATTDSMGNLEGNYVVPATCCLGETIVPGIYQILIIQYHEPPVGVDYFSTKCLDFEVTAGNQVSLDAYPSASAGTAAASGMLPETGLNRLFPLGIFFLITASSFAAAHFLHYTFSRE